jgi:hypothetical protein
MKKNTISVPRLKEEILKIQVFDIPIYTGESMPGRIQKVTDLKGDMAKY